MEFPPASHAERGGWTPALAVALAIAALLLAPVGTFETEPWWPGWASRVWALNAVGVDKLVHMGLFALLGWTLLHSPLRAAKHAFGFILGLAALYGGVLELAQIAIPGRQGDVFDLAADVIGTAIVLILASRRSRAAREL